MDFLRLCQVRADAVYHSQRTHLLSPASSQNIHLWKDSHEDISFKESDIVKNISVNEDCSVNFTITPKHPHCPCCLHNAHALRQKLLNIKGVLSVDCIVVGIPGSERWMKSINS